MKALAQTRADALPAARRRFIVFGSVGFIAYGIISPLSLVLRQFLVAVVTIGLDTVLALYVIQVGLPRWSIAVSVALSCAISGIVPLIAVKMYKRFGKVSIITASAAVCAVSMIGYAFAGYVGALYGVALLLSSALLFGAADGINAALGNAIALAFAPKHLSGSHSAWVSGSWNVGNVIAPMLYTTLLYTGVYVPWLFGAVVMTVATAVYWSVRKYVPVGT